MAPQYIHTGHGLACRACGSEGFLSITDAPVDTDWSIAAAGFIILAMDRSNPSNSVMRCAACGSSNIIVGLAN